MPVLLSVVIPTLNRSRHVSELCRVLSDSFQRAGLTNSEVEIVVSNNNSVDDTAAVLDLEQRTNAFLKIITPEKFLPTAEENLMFAFDHASGSYSWILGDDDLPHDEGINRLISLVRENRHDILIFDSRMISSKGRLVTERRSLCQSGILEENFSALAQRLGLWFVIAGFSTTVVRRNALNTEKLKEIMAIGPIYAHTIWLLHAFFNRPAIFINQPLVDYRLNEDIAGPFANLAKKNSHFEKIYWTLHPILHFKWIVEQGACNETYFKKIAEQNLDHDRFRLIDCILNAIHQEVLSLWCRPKDFHITADQLQIVCEFLKKVDPLLNDQIHHISDMHGAALARDRNKFREAGNSVAQLVFGATNAGVYQNSFIGVENNFHIYNLGYTFVACHSNHLQLLREEKQWVDPQDRSPYFFASENLEELKSKLQNLDSRLLYPYKTSESGKLKNFLQRLFLGPLYRIKRFIPEKLRRLMHRALS